MSSAVPVVIVLDGPAGSGKSSAARRVAEVLGLRYLDTGAMYRAVTQWLLDEGVDVDDQDAVSAAVQGIDLEVRTDPADPRVYIFGNDFTDTIRSRAVSNAVSAVSAVPRVRDEMVGHQRALLAQGGVVAEGRDLGSVVAPDATLKVFLTASSDVRARRRLAELEDDEVTLELTQDEMRRRDHLDSSRTVSPLIRPADAVVLDSSDLDLVEVVDAIVQLVRDGAKTSDAPTS